MKSTKKKVLVVPGAFVPYNDTVTLISYKHLRNLNADIDVLALRGKEDETIMECLKKDSSYSKFHIEYFCDYDDAVATFERKNVISAWINFHRYAKAAVKKARSGEYAVVYTNSVPVFPHLAGYYVKRKLKDQITWVASFSDPILKSPYKYDPESFKEYNIVQKIGFYVYIWLFMPGRYETLAQKYADKVVYITDELRDFMISNAKNQEEARSKAMVIPLNYIEDWSIYQNLLNSQTVDNTPKIFSHFGRIYGLRKIDSFLDALAELKNEDSKLCEKMQFHQYGQLIDRYMDKIKANHLEDLVIVHDKIAYEECMERMHDSDVLCLFDTIMPEDQVQPYFPSKSLEYMLLHKSLLIVSPSTSPTTRIFKELGYTTCRDSKEEIKLQIKKILCNEDTIPKYSTEQYENREAVQPLVGYIASKL